MADTTFVDGLISQANRIVAAWLNDVNVATYRANASFAGVTAAMFRTAAAVLLDQPFSVKNLGAKGDGATDDSVAVQAIIALAQAINGAVYFPPTSTGYKVGTGLLVTAPITLMGLNYTGSSLHASGDITVLSFSLAASGSVVRDLQILGPGTGTSTKPGVLCTNANYIHIERCLVKAFRYGVRYSPGINASYLCSIADSQIIMNGVTNIDAQLGTNALCISNTSFGGTPAQIGLSVVDSNSLALLGGDCEGVSVCAVDLDASGTLQAGHLIGGVHFEANNSSGGDVRIGNTAAVMGVTLPGNFYKPGTSIAGVNAIRGGALLVDGGVLHSGYASVAFIQIGAAFGTWNILSLGNLPAGVIGEELTATAASSAVSLSSGVVANIVSKSITAGDWLLTGSINLTFAATTSYTRLQGGVSPNTGALYNQDTYFAFSTPAAVPTAGIDQGWPCPVYKVRLTAPTTFYLVVVASFSVDTLKAGGTLRAERVMMA